MEFFNDVGGDPYRPSLFELVAQEQLRDLLQPALKYVLSVFAQRYPRYLLRIVNRHEEFYALLMFFVERHNLRTQNASFAENFYGLKRRRTPLYETDRSRAAVGGFPEDEKLRSKEIVRSLIFLVGVPYLRAKAQDYYEALGGGLDNDLLEDELPRRPAPSGHEESLLERVKAAFKQFYPYINIGYELTLLIYNVAYLFDYTNFYRPWLSWIGVDIRRLGADDMRLSLTRPQQSRKPPAGWLATIRYLLIRSPRLLLDSLRILLPTAIFFIKFLEWWYSPSSPARSISTSPAGPKVPPPKRLDPHPQGIPIDPTKYGECSICRDTISNATALPSGYVFCYRCAFDHVSEHGTCPVTLLPVQIWQIRKILI